MSYLPISGIVPQYINTATGLPYSGAVLKAYADGTATNIAFATDTTGGTTATSSALNSDGYPEISNSIIIPHLDQDYKLALYPTQAAADANSGAIWTVDNIPLTDQGVTFTATETGTGDAYEIALTLPTGVVTTGQRLQFIASEANVGACTLNVNALGAISIKSLDGTDPYDNAIVATMIVDVQYDGTNYQLMNPSADPLPHKVLTTTIAGAATTTMTVSGLDSTYTDGYEVDGFIVYGSTNQSIKLELNADTTTTNYDYTQGVLDAAYGQAAGNANTITQGTANSLYPIQFKIIQSSVTGEAYAIGSIGDAGIDDLIVNFVIKYTVTDNLTSVALATSASNIGVGSYLRVKRIV